MSEEEQAQADGFVFCRSRTGVAVITLNRPAAANAIAPEQRDAIIGMLEEAGAAPDVRAVLIQSTGRHFCAGADVSRIAGARDTPRAERRAGDVTQTLLQGAQRLIAAVLDCRKPVVAAVQGTAAGLGAHLAFAADLVVAAEDAGFVESFVLRGLVVDAGGAYLLPRRVGLQKAKELAFFGDRLPAAQARDLGLVNQVVPAAELEEQAFALAARLAAGPTTAIALTKRMLNRSLDADRATAFLEEAMAQEINAATHDGKEGVAAFMARRPARFQGF